MYAGQRYAQHPERAASIMAGSGETMTYANTSGAPTGWRTCCAPKG
jgi:hypothetical protein